MDGPWKVSFQPGRGAPASVTLDKLRSREQDSADAGVKYFSGARHLHEDNQARRSGSRRARSCGWIWAR